MISVVICDNLKTVINNITLLIVIVNLTLVFCNPRGIAWKRGTDNRKGWKSMPGAGHTLECGKIVRLERYWMGVEATGRGNV